MIRYGDVIGKWVAEQTGGTYCGDHSIAIGLFPKNGGCIIAGVIFEGWTGKSIVAHLAIKGRMNREFLWAISDYAFRQHGVHKVLAPIYSDNKRMINLAINMGFELEGVIEDAQPNGAIYFLTLTKERCRFLEEKYGKAKTARIA